MSTVHDLCFDADWYLSNYKDVAAAGVDPSTHYINSGRFEGRRPCAKNASPHMKVWDTARQAAAIGDWDGALKTLNETELNDFVQALRHPDATLLVLEILTVSGAFDRAQDVLETAQADFGSTPALSLARSNISTGQTAFNAANLQDAFPKKTKLGLKRGSMPLFDQLTASCPNLRMIRAQPKVTVIVPVLNASRTLETALGSLVTQTWANLEILVVDNGSTDGSQEIADRFRHHDARISMLDASDDPGAYPARNAGFAAATGQFVTVFDADDWAHPEKIARQAKAMIKTPSAQATLSDWARATSDLRFTNTREDVSMIHPNMSSLMIRTALRDTLGYWDRVRADADTEYHRRILYSYGNSAVQQVLPGLLLSIGRSHGGSLTQDTVVSNETATPRQVYQRSAAQWHDSTEIPYMDQYPTTRPFSAPNALTKGMKPL